MAVQTPHHSLLDRLLLLVDGQPARPDPPALTAYRARMYRFILLLAAAYNLAFGAWAGFWPRSFFHVFQLRQLDYPAIWACLGMVVGVYGLAYAYAAVRLDAARPLVALGLLGKILGPLGWMTTVAAGQWPLRTFSLIVFNDLVWWLPLGLFLLEGTRLGARLRAWAPYACAAVHAVAAVALAVALRPGTEVVTDEAARAAYIGHNPLLWRGGWAVWLLAALSLLGFYAWWGARLPSVRWALAGFALAVLGLLFDFWGESVYIAWLPEHMVLQRFASLLTGAGANGLYTAAGVVLTLATPGLRGWPARGSLEARVGRAWTWAAWAAGAALSVAALANSAAGMAVAGGALMALLVPWFVWMGRKLA
jgi:hypothetical protein